MFRDNVSLALDLYCLDSSRELTFTSLKIDSNNICTLSKFYEVFRYLGSIRVRETLETCLKTGYNNLSWSKFFWELGYFELLLGVNYS